MIESKEPSQGPRQYLTENHNKIVEINTAMHLAPAQLLKIAVTPSKISSSTLHMYDWKWAWQWHDIIMWMVFVMHSLLVLIRGLFILYEMTLWNVSKFALEENMCYTWFLLICTV